MRVVIIGWFALTGLLTFAQSQQATSRDSIPPKIKKQFFIYDAAKKFNDPLVARVALYHLLAENPTNVTTYDSLAYSYFSFGQFASAALVSQQVLKIAPDNKFALNIAASSFDRLGVKDKALNFFERFYLKENDNLMVLYKIAFLEFELDRFAEADESANQIIENPKAKDLIVSFPKLDNKNETQDVPLSVACYRIKAMIEEAKGNIDEAKIQYFEVLNMYPGFQQVQQQLRNVSKEK